MFELIKPENVVLTFALLLPGLIISYVRSKFITGRRPSTSEILLVYLVLSAIFYCLLAPLLPSILSIHDPWWARLAVWFGLIILGPACLGIILGVYTQKQYGAWIAAKFNLSIVHVIPTAWDWRFSTIPRGGLFVLVTLTNGGSVAGYFGLKSFASSDGAERDIYIEEEYDLASNGSWAPRPAKVGILIAAKEIKYIEFWDPV